MQQQLLDDDGVRTWAVILDTGDEVTSCLLAFANSEHLRAAHLTAIGAFDDAVLGYFDWERKDYRRIPFAGQVEVVSLLGDVALHKNEPRLHMHAVLGLADGQVRGGHLLEGRVRPTLEVILTETPSRLERRHDPATGLALIRIDRKSAERACRPLRMLADRGGALCGGARYRIEICRDGGYYATAILQTDKKKTNL